MKDCLKLKLENAFDKIEKNPSLINVGRYGLEEFRRDGCLDLKYIKMWEVALDLPISDLRSLVLSETEIGADLRKTLVFTKLL